MAVRSNLMNEKHKWISAKSIHSILSNLANRQTNRDRQAFWKCNLRYSVAKWFTHFLKPAILCFQWHIFCDLLQSGLNLIHLMRISTDNTTQNIIFWLKYFNNLSNIQRYFTEMESLLESQMIVFSSILQNKSISLCAAVKCVACQMCASVSKWIDMWITYLCCWYLCLLLNQPLCCSFSGAKSWKKKYSHHFQCLTFDLYILPTFSF